MTVMWPTLIWSRRAVAMFVCMSILFFFSISSGRELAREGGGGKGGGVRKGGRESVRGIDETVRER